MSVANLTENDQRILAMAWHCFAEMPKVDYKKLAELGGYKTPASATTAYHNARKKLMNGATVPAAGAGGASNASVPSTPKATGKKRAATETPADGTTKKRGRKSKAETLAVPTIETDANEDQTKGDATDNGEAIIKDEGDDDDGATEKVLSGAKDFIDGEAEVKSEEGKSADGA